MLKRITDLSVSAVLLIALTPIFAAVAVAIVLESGFPVFFRQERAGKDFRPFRIWKFRSMRQNNSGPKITSAGDKRITRVGRLIRKAKLDELPQLWNVLTGDMSLVGPRPEVYEYVEQQRERYRRILQVRPGITDLASVAYFDEERVLAAAQDPIQTYVQVVLPRKLNLADQYLDACSLALDARILWWTACAVVRKRPFEVSGKEF